jgi:predicted glycoside hydrolase/deacetylase ChbG (UPF0249 family)
MLTYDQNVLIVNADDFGASPTTTDAVLTAFAAGVITSCSAMVWMRDSSRATELARDLRLPVGLHLNLTAPFDGDDVPQLARQRQFKLTQAFGATTWLDDSPRRPPRKLIVDAVLDQLEQFTAAFGEPTHLDGHHHIHVHDAVLDVLPANLVIRSILRDPLRADEPDNRRERHLHKRFRAPSLTLAFERLHPALGGVGLAPLSRAHKTSLEVMSHPAQPGQLDALMSHDWRAAMARVPVGSFAVLAEIN